MSVNDALELNRLHDRLRDLELKVGRQDNRVRGTGWKKGAEPCVDQTQIIDAETATAGTATTPPRSDGVQGLLLRKNTDETPKAISALMFGSASSGLQLQIAAAADENAERAATAHANPTFEVVPAGGGQVKLAPWYDGSYGHLSAESDGIRQPLNAAGAIVNTATGLKVNKGDGIDIDGSNLLVVKPDTSGLAVSVGAGGVKVAIPKLDALATPDDGTTLDAGTARHGLLLKATAPAAGLRSVVAIDNAETAYKNAALFDATNPANLGTAAPGTAMTAARRDHVHAGGGLLLGGTTILTADADILTLGGGGSDLVSSDSLAAGTYLVSGKLVFHATAADAIDCYIKNSDGDRLVDGGGSHDCIAGAFREISFPMVKLTLTGTDTLTLRALSGVSDTNADAIGHATAARTYLTVIGPV